MDSWTLTEFNVHIESVTINIRILSSIFSHLRIHVLSLGVLFLFFVF